MRIAYGRVDPRERSAEDREALRAGALMILSNTLAVIGAVIVALAFLMLEGELLRPRGLVPTEDRVAKTLGRLLAASGGQSAFGS